MQAVLSGSVSIAGLLLIFSGFLFSQATSFPSSTPDETIAKYRRAARFGVLPFAVSMLVGIISLMWLVNGGDAAYQFSIVGFFVALILTVLYGSATIVLYL